MSIEAILHNDNLEVRIQEEGWKKLLQTFHNEKVLIDSVHFSKDGEVVLVEDNDGAATWDEVLEFCAGTEVLLAEFIRRCDEAGLTQLSDLHLINTFFELTYEYDVFKIHFRNYVSNPTFQHWLKKTMTASEAEKLWHQIESKKG